MVMILNAFHAEDRFNRRAGSDAADDVTVAVLQISCGSHLKFEIFFRRDTIFAATRRRNRHPILDQNVRRTLFKVGGVRMA